MSNRTAAAWRLLLALLAVLLADTLLDEGSLAGTAASAALVLLCAAALRTPSRTPLPAGSIRTAIRDRDLRTAFLAQRDPDAAGRPRPRAPGRRLAATAA